uniref:Putative secreted protein n=1 Tax=Anopheles darlingi TaxID=43151 RepID=A0A2M4DD24_ANODA
MRDVVDGLLQQLLLLLFLAVLFVVAVAIGLLSRVGVLVGGRSSNNLHGCKSTECDFFRELGTVGATCFDDRFERRPRFRRQQTGRGREVAQLLRDAGTAAAAAAAAGLAARWCNHLRKRRWGDVASSLSGYRLSPANWNMIEMLIIPAGRGSEGNRTAGRRAGCGRGA